MRIIIEVAGRAGRRPKLFAFFLRKAIEAMVAYNRSLLRHGEVPTLYASGVRYAEEPPPERIRDALTVYKEGTGDCAHLSAWRAAELQEKGEKARIRLTWKPSRRKPGKRLYHVQVRRQDGSIEDPSRKLGMGRI